MARRQHNHNRTGRRRTAFLLVLCAVVFLLFLARLVQMQFFRAAEYAEKAAAASTTVYQTAVPAARGVITDRNGQVLAQDETVWDVQLVVPAPTGTDLTDTVQTLQTLLGGKDVETQLAAFCSAVSAGELTVARDISAEQQAALAQAGLLQSGAVRLSARARRSWPDGTLAPHLLGLVGPMDADQWAARREDGLAMDAEIGQSGLESVYEDLLRGTPGSRTVAAKRSGAAAVTETAATPGAALELYLDAELQAVLRQALWNRMEELKAIAPAGKGREVRAGAAVAVEVKTGGILAAVSLPDYDLNTYRQDYAALASNATAPLTDRVCRGLYAPGSAFKPAVAAAALTAGIDPAATVNCTGTYRWFAGYQPGCLQYSHRGPVDLRTALQHSCNIYFYDVGRRLGVDTFSAMARLLGLADDSGAELPAAEGRLTWTTDDNYQKGLTLMAAIGQGNTAVTPLQLVTYAATLANLGRRPALHYARQAVAADGTVVWKNEERFTTVEGGEPVFGPIRDGMTQMAQTLRVLREAPIPCAAKTGSPQLPAVMANGEHYTNSVLIGYAPADAPEIAVAVVLEYGGGGANAAPVLRAVLDWMATR